MKELREANEAGFLQEIGNPHNTSEYIAFTQDHERGKNLPKDWMPYSTYWLMDNDEFIGELRIRPALTEHLRNIGGQIGYTIKPSKRKKGYGKKILELAIPKAKGLGLKKILITCDETNLASKKIIEANGGVFEKTNKQGKGKPKKLLYWIAM